ncbi:MAG: hypothetical protein GY861_21290 [bacterium]|nr:hypothetical protein [bacterium]
MFNLPVKLENNDWVIPVSCFRSALSLSRFLSGSSKDIIPASGNINLELGNVPISARFLQKVVSAGYGLLPANCSKYKSGTAKPNISIHSNFVLAEECSSAIVLESVFNGSTVYKVAIRAGSLYLFKRKDYLEIDTILEEEFTCLDWFSSPCSFHIDSKYSFDHILNEHLLENDFGRECILDKIICTSTVEIKVGSISTEFSVPYMFVMFGRSRNAEPDIVGYCG